jgi:hypothetical protein
MPLSPGDKLGPYEILAPLGAGGMGEVYRIGTYRDVELDVTRPFAKTLEALLRQKQATRISLRRLAVTESRACSRP